MTIRRRAQAESSPSSADTSDADDHLQEVDKGDGQENGNGHVKPFYLPSSWWAQLFSVPQQIVFALAGLFGMANFARQIVRVTPKRPGYLKLRGGRGGEGEQQDVAQWINANVPSLRESFNPSWWIPK